jgi:NRAMP (natural resistance-associated macrophage protein)-like metal ion transporter
MNTTKKKRFSLKGIAAFLAVMGPGLITSNVDNDATGITGYAIAGASYGYRMLWVLALATVALAVIQGMNTKLGCITGKGLSDLIRERFGVRVTAMSMLLLLIANIATTVAEFAGVAASMELFGVDKLISVPIAAIAVWLLVVKGSYRYVEKILLVFCLVFFAYVFAAFAVNPPWGEVFRSLISPSIDMDPAYLSVALGTIGTTIAPWMLFYLQGAIADKGTRASQYKYAKWDAYIGALATDFFSFFMVVTTAATLYVSGIRIESAADAARALEPLAGPFAKTLFAIGLLNASVMAAAVLPLSTAYAITEAFGWEGGVNRKFSDAPVFFGLYTFIIILGAVLVLIPGIPLVVVMNLPNLVGGALLPVILVLMIKLVNDRALMGKYVNGWLFNGIAWATAILVAVLTVMLVVTSFMAG